MHDRLDAELVAAACQGDVRCFGELYRRHYAAVLGIACAVLSDRHLAEDAAQEAFAFACRDLDRLSHPEKFASWVGAICRRVAKQFAKARLRYSAPRDFPPPTEWPSNASPPDAGHAGAESDGDYALVRRAVQRLSKSAREVIVLHYFSGLTYEQIAAVLGISTQAVHGRLLRARRKLANVLQRNGFGRSES
jgi:RNA polymerase sigma-70 factor (ECF subfamily)